MLRICYVDFMKFVFLIVFTLSALATFDAQAQVKKEDKIPSSSPTHTVGFMFHKLAGTEPDYSKWVDVYVAQEIENYGEEGRRELIRKTQSTLKNYFKNFDLEDNWQILVTVDAKLEIVPFEKKYLLNISTGEGAAFIVRETPEFDINIVVPDMEKHFGSLISNQELNQIGTASSQSFEKPKQVKLVLRLKPISVDAQKPLLINGKEYWLMLSDFAGFEIWDGLGAKHIWTYVSEEEKKENLNELRSLFKE